MKKAPSKTKFLYITVFLLFLAVMGWILLKPSIKDGNGEKGNRQCTGQIIGFVLSMFKIIDCCADNGKA